MRICSKNIKLIRPVTLPEEQREDKPKKKRTRSLTAAQKRKIEEFKKRLEEESRGPVNTIPRGAEWR